MTKHIKLFEHKPYPLSDLNLSEHVLDYLSTLSVSEISSELIFHISRKELKARHFVGVINFGGYQIEILPKLLTNSTEDDKETTSKILSNLIYMLSYSHKLHISEQELARLAKERGSFLEVLISIYASRLQSLLKRCYPMSYIVKEENLTFIKGKILINQNFKANPVDQSKTYCKYDEFSEDNDLSRFLKFISHKLFLLSSNPESKRRLKNIFQLLANVSNEQFDQTKANKIVISRTNQAFLNIFNLAKMFLSKTRTSFNGKSDKQFSLLFDMNELFEEFIIELIRRNKTFLGVNKVSPQKGKRLVKSVFDRSSNTFVDKYYFNTYTDIGLNFNDDPREILSLILDIKYKVLENTVRQGIKNADVYQILTYQNLHSSMSYEPVVALMYPESDSPGDRKYGLNTIHDKSFFSLTLDLKMDLQTNNTKLLELLKEKLYFTRKSFKG